MTTDIVIPTRAVTVHGQGKNCKETESEMAQQFRAPTVLPDDRGLIPSTHMVATNHQEDQFQEI